MFQTGGTEFPERANEVACCYRKFLHQPAWVCGRQVYWHTEKMQIYVMHNDVFPPRKGSLYELKLMKSALLHTFCGLCLPGQSLTSVLSGKGISHLIPACIELSFQFASCFQFVAINSGWSKVQQQRGQKGEKHSAPWRELGYLPRSSIVFSLASQGTQKLFQMLLSNSE